MNTNERPLLSATEVCHFWLQIPGHLGIPCDEHTMLQLTQVMAHFPQPKAHINISKRSSSTLWLPPPFQPLKQNHYYPISLFNKLLMKGRKILPDFCRTHHGKVASMLCFPSLPCHFPIKFIFCLLSKKLYLAINIRTIFSLGIVQFSFSVQIVLSGYSLI